MSHITPHVVLISNEKVSSGSPSCSWCLISGNLLMTAVLITLSFSTKWVALAVIYAELLQSHSRSLAGGSKSMEPAVAAVAGTTSRPHLSVIVLRLRRRMKRRNYPRFEAERSNCVSCGRLQLVIVDTICKRTGELCLVRLFVL